KWGAHGDLAARRLGGALEADLFGRRHDLPAMWRSLAMDGRDQRPRDGPQNHRPPWDRGAPKAIAAGARAGPVRVASEAVDSSTTRLTRESPPRERAWVMARVRFEKGQR